MFSKITFGIGLIVLSSLTQSSSAETVEEYTAAANNNGCMAIPYSNLREKCITHQTDAKDWCDAKGARTCDESGLRSDSFLEKIRNLENAIREKSSQNKPDEVHELEGKKRQAENELAAARKEVERRRDITQQCIQHRVLVQEVFKSATDRVESDLRDSSKAAIHATLERIRQILSQGQAGHETQIQGAQRSLEFCKQQL